MANGKDKAYYEMTPEQALDKLDKTVIGNLMLKIALTKALELQIPHKPKPYKNFEGQCKCGVVFLDKATNHCGNCGQKLDWEG